MFIRILLSTFLASLVLGTAFGQSSSIKGKVTDSQTGEAVIGANVLIVGTSQGAVADIDGNFSIPNVKVGTYDVVISFISYTTDTLRQVVVTADKPTILELSLREESTSLEEFVVSAQRMRNTDVSIISDIKASQLVVTGISAQQISLSQDRDAAQVVKRIPGITILDNKFVNVRGLSERYSVVMLNGVIAPSTEVDTRAFAFDLLPSNMIDRMMIYKSGSAHLPGDFAGAVIDVTTKSVLDENSLSVNFTAGFRAGTTFQSFNREKGSETDWLGFDNGARHLPDDFPTRNLRTYTNDLSSYRNRLAIGNAGASLNNNWQPFNSVASPDLRTTINFSRTSYIGKMTLGNITSISYSNTKQRFDTRNYYYEGYDPISKANVGRRYAYHDYRDVSNARVGLISNFSLAINPSHTIEFRNLFNQQGNSQVTARTGVEDVQNFEVNNLSLNYTQRSLYSGQLVGKHELTDRLNVNWILGLSKTAADQPDYKRLRSQRAKGSDDLFTVIIPPSSNPVDGRFFSELNESVITQVVNVDYKLNPHAEQDKQSKISFGYYGAQTKRDFSARWFSFNTFPGVSPDLGLLTNNVNEIFVRENLLNPEDGSTNPAYPMFFLDEGTTGADAYNGKNIYHAGYASAFMPFGNWNVSVGSRLEYNRQQLNSESHLGVVRVDNPLTSILPFMNVTYNYSPKTLIRAAYSKTVNRPNFRELAPFNYYDFDRNADTYGNPLLKVANIHNVDLRWEHYAKESESISFGVFYKHFIDPIETKLDQGSNLIYSFTNAEQATSFGVEVEARKSLDGLTNSTFIDKMSVTFNAALINSKVKMKAADAVYQAKERAMQGQSPYILNAGINYSDLQKGIQVNVAYNVYGKRIFAIGDYNAQTGVSRNPSQYEMPRHQLDLTISKDIGEKFNLKFGIQDILNQRYQLIQDSNSNEKISGFDDTIQQFKPGQYVTLGVTYKVF
jgi:TonB-dependent receptor